MKKSRLDLIAKIALILSVVLSGLYVIFYEKGSSFFHIYIMSFFLYWTIKRAIQREKERQRRKRKEKKESEVTKND